MKGITVEQQLEKLKMKLDLYLDGAISHTNLGPHPPYTPDVIAVMDAQAVVELAAGITALCAIIAVREARGMFD